MASTFALSLHTRGETATSRAPTREPRVAFESVTPFSPTRYRFRHRQYMKVHFLLQADSAARPFAASFPRLRALCVAAATKVPPSHTHGSQCEQGCRATLSHLS